MLFGKKKHKNEEVLEAEVVAEEKPAKSASAPESAPKELEAVAEEEVFVDSEVEKELEAVAEENIVAEVEPEIEFLNSEVDMSDEAKKVAEAAKKLAEAAHQAKLEKEAAEKAAAEAEEKAKAEAEAKEKAEKEAAEAKAKAEAEENAKKQAEEAKAKEEAQKKSETAEIEKIVFEAEVENPDEDEKKEADALEAGLNNVLDDEKIAKLNAFVDLCIEKNLKYKTYIKIAKVLIAAYGASGKTEEGKELTLKCIKKLLPALAEAKLRDGK